MARYFVHGNRVVISNEEARVGTDRVDSLRTEQDSVSRQYQFKIVVD